MRPTFAPILLAAAVSLTVGCSSSGGPSAPTADAGRADGGTRGPGDAGVQGGSDAGAAADAFSASGTDGSISTPGDAGTCGFSTVGEASAYVGNDEDGLPMWTVFGFSSSAALTLEGYGAYDGPTSTGTYALRPEDGSYETCGLCIILRTGCNGDTCAKTFMPAPGQGSLTLTELGVAGQKIVGTLDGVRLREVTIDANTFATTPVAGGEAQCLSGVAFEARLDAIENMAL